MWGFQCPGSKHRSCGESLLRLSPWMEERTLYSQAGNVCVLNGTLRLNDYFPLYTYFSFLQTSTETILYLKKNAHISTVVKTTMESPEQTPCLGFQAEWLKTNEIVPAAVKIFVRAYRERPWLYTGLDHRGLDSNCRPSTATASSH